MAFPLLTPKSNVNGIFNDEKYNCVSLDDFQVNKFMSRAVQSREYFLPVRDILRIPHHLRSNAKCALIVDILCSIEFFAKLSPVLVREIAKVATYVRVPKEEVLFYQGSIGTTFFVIMNGRVNIHVQDLKNELDIGYNVGQLSVFFSGYSISMLL